MLLPACLLIQPGTYNDDLRLSKTTPCAACPGGLSTSQPGASSVSACDICKAGWGEANCNTRCGGSNGANYGPAARPLGSNCVPCTDQKVGFNFDWLGAAQLYQPAVVTRSGAESPADCLSEFGQVVDSAFHMGGDVAMTAVPSATTFDACVAACKADTYCQYMTWNYDTSSCSKKVQGSGRWVSTVFGS